MELHFLCLTLGLYPSTNNREYTWLLATGLKKLKITINDKIVLKLSKNKTKNVTQK